MAAREAAHEGVIAAELRALAVGRAPLAALLTTATRLAADPVGAFGPVWREADTGHRRHWLRLGQAFPPHHMLTTSQGAPADANRPPRTARPPPHRPSSRANSPVPGYHCPAITP